MELVILGATGGTGRHLVRLALDRGHDVIAVARDPSRVERQPRLHAVQADVRRSGALLEAIGDGRIILSGLGVSKGGKAGTLHAGAQAAIATRPERLIWLGAIGTGASARMAGWLTRNLLRLMGAELHDKVAADTAVIAAGGTVFHAGPLSDRPIGPRLRTLCLDDVPARLFPARISRASVASLMLDEAETPRHPGETVVPLEF